MEYFRDNLKWDDYMCAALVGCMMAKSRLSSKYYDKGEKNGTNTSSPYCNKEQPYGEQNSPWSYSAGLLGWKQTNRKESAIQLAQGINKDKAIVTIKSRGIEGLSFDQQLHMIIMEITQGQFKDNFTIAMSKCESLQDAVATVYCRYANGYSSKTSIPNESDIKRIDKTETEYNKCLSFAEYVLDEYHKSIDI